MVKTNYALLLLLLAFSTITFGQSTRRNIQVIGLTCDQTENPIGLDNPAPVLGWQMTGARRNQFQSAYRILVASQLEKLVVGKADIWDTDKVVSDQSIQIKFSGKHLESCKKYFWKVMVWDKTGQPSGWSEVASWQMGLLDKLDWGKAMWIARDDFNASQRIVPGVQSPAHDNQYKNVVSGKHLLPQFRKEIHITRTIKNATVFISGLGHYEMMLNGQKTGDRFLAPGWTNYDKYSLYNTFDVTKQLNTGVNVIGVMLGNGFYNVPNERYRKLLLAYGNPKMIFKLRIEYADGTWEEIVSDASWKVVASPVTFSSIYGGEDYNATLEQPGWTLPRFDDSSWKPSRIVKGPEKIISEKAPPLKIFDQFEPVKITEPKTGSWVYDLGQNFSGIPQLYVAGSKNAVVKIIPAELLTDSGTVIQAAVGDPVYFNYTLKGGDPEQWQPQFTYYGFRYVQIEGAVPEGKSNPMKLPVIKSLKGLHTRNSAKAVGTFSCSKPLFNAIFKLIDWSIKSNMASILTDCPHREKLGWLEETHLMGNSLRYNYDMSALLAKSVQDMQAAQLDDGLIPDIAPEYARFDEGFRDSPEWGSAGILVPWYLYQWYGDRAILENYYATMKRYLTYLQHKADHNQILYQGLGDWYDIGPNPPGPSQRTPAGITSTAIYYYDVVIMQKIAGLLKKPEEAVEYDRLGKEIKNNFNKTFFDPVTGQYGTGSQTANAMALYMNLVPPAQTDKIFSHLIHDIHTHGNAMTAGDIGFRYLIQTLQREGASNIIFDMNSKSDVPGYGYQLEHGATALTESWAALRFVSNNHFMLGHLMEWFYSGLGGIQQDDNAVAFKEIIINPQMVGDVTEATTTHESVYGKIACHWKIKNTSTEVQVEIPVNTTATVYLPGSSLKHIQESGKPIEDSKYISFLTIENDKVLLKIGSGKYLFTVTR